MNKLTAIKIKYNDGTYSDEIPVSVLAENVLLSGKSVNLADALGNVRVAAAGNIQQQLDQLASKKIDMQLLDDYIANQLGDATTAWLNEHIGQIGTTIVLDSSLKVSGAAADAKAVGDGINQAIQTIQNQMSDKVDNGYVEDGVAYFTSGDDILFSITGIGGGGGSGGGGESSSSTLVLQNLTGWVSKTISLNSDCELVFNWSSIMDGYITGAGTAAVQVRGATVLTKSVNQGRFSIDVKKYLQSGSNKVKVTVTDAYGNMKSIIFTINIISLNITSTFDQGIVRTGAFDILYTVTGTGDKIVHVILDGTAVGTDLVQTSGRQSNYGLNAMSHGAHNLEIYATETVDGEDVESNHLYFSIIATQSGNNTPIISSSFNTTTVKQYETVVIPYYVYDPINFTSEIGIYVNGELYSSQTVDRTRQLVSYRTKTSGSLIIEIRYGNVSKSFSILVEQADSSLTPITRSLTLHLSSEGRSNNEANPGVWTYELTSSEFANFNFVSDGWLHDEDGNTMLRVTGDARLTIDYLPFEDNFTIDGKTIEFEFKTCDVLNYDAEIITCWSNNRGIIFTPQKATIGSEQVSTSTQYKEDEHVRISFVIDSASTRLLYIYINGIISGVIRYADGDNFAQYNPAPISIGSSECTVDLYNIRVYNRALSSEEIVTNWIADTQDVNEMMARYERNDIRENGEISMEKLTATVPYLLIECEELSQNKKDKKIISGRYVDPVNPEMSFTYDNATCSVQGTSSAGYPRKNYKIKFSNFTNNDGETSSTYCLRGPGKSIPSKVFCFKADFASSEGANNVELVRLYEDACPVKSEAQEADKTGLVRQGIDGVPIVLFWYKPSTGITTFMGKYNFNFDKSSPVFGFQDGDESWETIDNANDWAEFHRADFEGEGWLSAFEARYPDLDDPPYTDSTNLSAMAKWVNSTDTDGTPYEIRLPDNIVFRGGGHPANGSSVFNKAPETSFWKNLCVIRSPVYKWSLSKLKNSWAYDEESQCFIYSNMLFSLNFVNSGSTMYSDTDLDKDNQTRYSGITRFNAKTGEALGYNSASNAYMRYTDEGGRLGVTSGGSPANNQILFTTAYTDGIYFDIPVYEQDASYFCAYWSDNPPNGYVFPIGVNPGDIIFAGENTPYYGLKNINSTLVMFEEPVVYREEYEKGKYKDYTFYFDSEQYRIAKFRYELENWFNKDDVLFYYLFTELFLMVDSRVKNSFPTRYMSHEGSKWMWLPYDMDTAMGINNEGVVVFDYSLEDTDMKSDEAYVYNSSDTVMWNNVRRAFSKELADMYIDIRDDGILSYDVVEKRFEDHQDVWSETVFNEDAYYKYIQPLINGGENNLKMCLGSKEEQRKWWLFNRFRYIDSKYTAGYALDNYIQCRVYRKSDLTITPYASIYASASFDSSIVRVRALRGKTVKVKSPDTWNPGGSDSVLRIYSVDQLADLGDLSGFYVGDISFAMATKLQRIKLGDSSPGYSNPNIDTLELGNNTLLKSLDVRNCPNLTNAVDISGCTNIEEIYFDGTSITGLNMPNGGVISTLHLPGTIVNLTILNQKNITDFVLPDYSNLATLRIENSSINELPILLGMPDNRRVRLVNVDWQLQTAEETRDIVAKLDSMRGIDENGNNTAKPQVSGRLHAKEIDNYMLEILTEQYPNLIVTYETAVPHEWLFYKYLQGFYDGTSNPPTLVYNNPNLTTICRYGLRNLHFAEFNCPNIEIIEPHAFESTKILSMPFSLPHLTSLTACNTFYNFKGDISLKDVFPNVETLIKEESNNDYSNMFSSSYISAIDWPSVKTIVETYGDGTPQNPVKEKMWHLADDCPNLKYIYLPNYEADISGNFYNNCPVLEYVIAPKVELGIMNQGKLSNCPNLKFIDINRTTGIGRPEFWDELPLLEHLVLRSENLSTFHTSTPDEDGPFVGNNPLIKVYVPRSKIIDYQQATNWSIMYANNIVTFLPLEDYTVDGTLTGEFDYNLIGLEVYHHES